MPVDGGEPTHLCPAGQWLLTANYGTGSVSTLPLGPDGAPGPVRHVLRHEGGGPDPGRQQGPHAHAVLPAPGGRRLVSADLGTDSLRVCSLDPGTGRLDVHQEAALPPGTGPRHLAFHPRGDRAYVLGELDSTLTTLAWDGQAGRLTVLDRVGTVPPQAAAGTRNYPSGLVASPDGCFLWVANRGHDSITVFTLGPDGDPVFGTTVPCGGHWPRDLAHDPAGGRLYAANERSGEVTWFDVDPHDGTPRRAGSLPVPAASCVVFT